METIFIRKAPTLSDAQTLIETISDIAIRTGDISDYNEVEIAKIVQVDDDTYDDIASDLLIDNELLIEHRNVAHVTADNVWHVLAIIAPTRADAMLINNEGYTYCRYVSILPKALLK